jgi:hypothetical protein
MNAMFEDLVGGDCAFLSRAYPFLSATYCMYQGLAALALLLVASRFDELKIFLLLCVQKVLYK